MLNVFRAEVRKNSKKRGLLSFTDHKIGYILVHGRIWENLLMTISEYCWGYNCSIAQSCLTLCDPMDCSTPGFLVLHYLPEFAQMHVHWVGEAIQAFHPLSSASPPALSFFPASRTFPVSWLSALFGQSIGASASVLPMNIQGWFPFRLTGLISLLSKGLSKSSSTMPKDNSGKIFSVEPLRWWKDWKTRQTKKGPGIIFPGQKVVKLLCLPVCEQLLREVWSAPVFGLYTMCKRSTIDLSLI